MKSFDEVRGKHLVQYEDAEEEVLDLEKERIEWVEEEAPRKLRRLRRVSSSPVSKMEVEESGGENGDSGDKDWGEDAGNEESEEVELEEEEEESIVKRSGSGTHGRSSSVGSGKRKKVDVEKLGCTKKFRFDGDGEKGGSSISPMSKSRSSTCLTTESEFKYCVWILFL